MAGFVHGGKQNIPGRQQRTRGSYPRPINPRRLPDIEAKVSRMVRLVRVPKSRYPGGDIAMNPP